MPDTTNKMAAAGFAQGAKKYQQRARTALPILVRQAKARQTMFYGELAHARAADKTADKAAKGEPKIP
jgi:cytochrome c556